jgi:hypothetical protein
VNDQYCEHTFFVVSVITLRPGHPQPPSNSRDLSYLHRGAVSQIVLGIVSTYALAPRHHAKVAPLTPAAPTSMRSVHLDTGGRLEQLGDLRLLVDGCDL